MFFLGVEEFNSLIKVFNLYILFYEAIGRYNPSEQMTIADIRRQGMQATGLARRVGKPCAAQGRAGIHRTL